MSNLVSIRYTPKGSTRKSEDAYVRLPLENAQLVAGHGIEGDRKGSSPKRQLNIMTQETLDELGKLGLHVAPGQMGEQLIISGVDVADLNVGDHIQIGESAVIEVGKPRTGCDRFEHIQGFDPHVLTGRLGIIASVVESGAIKIGDAVKVLHPQSV